MSMHSPGWQPIDTAPKDETLVLLWADEKVFMGSWNSYARDWLEPIGIKWLSPTHWMPLPAGPHLE